MAGRRVRRKGGSKKPRRSPAPAKEMLGTDGAFRALPRLPAQLSKEPGA